MKKCWTVLIPKFAPVDIDELSDLAFGASWNSTIQPQHWDEPRADDIAFCFEEVGPFGCFIAECDRLGLNYRAETPKDAT